MRAERFHFFPCVTKRDLTLLCPHNAPTITQQSFYYQYSTQLLILQLEEINQNLDKTMEVKELKA